MTKTQNKLAFMRLLGVYFILFCLIDAYCLYTAIAQSNCSSVLCRNSMSSPCTIPWYIEFVSLAIIGAVVGTGLFMKRSWGRVLYLSLLPVFVTYGFILCRTCDIKVIYIIPSMLFYAVTVIYFFRKNVKRALCEVK